jgi:tripartite-type tricarboxylate transporter receptor subunit TctC
MNPLPRAAAGRPHGIAVSLLHFTGPNAEDAMNQRYVAVFAALLASTPAMSQVYPTKPVHIIVPAATGGPDSIARIVSARMGQQIGQSFVVENRPGANGIRGADAVAKAPADGYTLMVYSSGFVVNPHIYKKLPYDTERDFVPVTNLVDNGGLFIAVNPAVPAKSLQELIDIARKPGSRLSYSTPGVGNTWHIAFELFNDRAGTQLVHIPYNGGGPAVAALVAGDVQAMVSSPAPIMNFAKSGKVRVLAYTGAKRAPALPDVPTTAEAGLPTYAPDGGWFGMFAPAKTSEAIVDRLYREAKLAMADPPTLEKIRALGVEPIGDTPAEFRKFVSAEIRKYGEWVKIAKIEPE